ncbi:uncharacterized protein LOC143302233 [Babylonia areolata]|uniref:uncharacterized protein LOC143302233 n=1 Tax=Babylonia areolata TaxID=304850 RepID=UPI003FD0AE51
MTGSKISILIYFLCIVIFSSVLAQSPDVGRILIGAQRNVTNPTTEYIYNSNFNPADGSIGFDAVVFNAGTQVSKDDTVDVTCLNEFDGEPGYTQLTFNTVNLPPGRDSGSVPFSVVRAGRAAAVRCYGISIGFLQCPATTNLTIPQPEFCRQTSLSEPVTITQRPSPVVSVCERVSFIPASSQTATFQVALSEAVKSTNVTVTCQQEQNFANLNYCQQPGVTCCQSNNIISVTPNVMTPGQTTATMNYQISRSNNQPTCVGVRCQANSNGLLPEGYFQYQASSSQDSSSEGLIQTLVPVLNVEPQYLTVYNTSFQSVLYLAASTNVPFQCQAAVVDSLQEALLKALPANIDCSFIFANTTTTTVPTTTMVNPTTGNSTSPANTTTPVPTTPPVDLSSPWLAVDNSFTVTSDTKFHVVRTRRELEVVSAVQEVVVTTCCSMATDPTSSYSDLKVASVAVAQLEPHRNNTGGVTSGASEEERFVVNPAYREVAPCPCDLTYLACDINCCCDQECTEADQLTFSGCIPGRLGGRDPDPDLRSCRSDHFPKDDWFPLMCVQFESNALLGEFYTKADKLTSVNEVNNKLLEEGKRSVYTYRETESRFTDLAEVNGYTEGSNILTILPQGGAGNLLLPRLTTSGRCLDSSPVQFLRDSESTCTRTLTPATCSDLTPFSARVYVQGGSVSIPACPGSFSISTDGRSLQVQFVDVRVNYHCASASATTAYIRDSNSVFSDLVSPQTVYSFPASLAGVNCTDLCGEDSACLGYNQGRGEAGMSSLPSRCPTDSGFELHPTPVYRAGSGTCDNVVLEVRYGFTWAGQSITGLTADLVMGSVQLAGGQAVVSQKFAVTFTHDYSGPANQTDNYLNMTTVYRRSGRPGYDFGGRVATGCSSVNVTTGVSSPVDQGEVSQMAVWSPGAEGLCEKAGRRFLMFGDDVQSSCVLRLAFNDINTCDSLRGLVLNHLNVLMPANVIGRYGYNSLDVNNNNWIGILREDPFPATTTTAPTTTATTTTTNLSNVTMTNLPTIADNITFDPLSVRGGVCRDIVSGIHLEVLYAETGRNNHYPLLEVVGAAVRYTVSNWSMWCVGPNAGRCHRDSTTTQPFLLTSSVQFTRVSPTTPQPPILFYQIHDKETCDSDTCYRFFDDFDTSMCHYDTCWHELFYPITQGYQGSEGVNYTRGFSLLFLLFVLGYVSVTKPWK